ncbi:hypothetical protein NC981_06945 [Leptolyngbya sp. DQ-M1]|uniref:hypothetical protein n=1 Tax=Leptolyngbya sp. DQ-M1 TaxID=2933920 RepID=UPI003297A92C
MDKFDFVAKDKDGNIILVGEVKTSGLGGDSKKNLRHYLSQYHGNVSFGMTVNSENIQIFRWNGQELSKPIQVLNTEDVLRFYEPKFGQKQIFESYLTTLVEAWLRDLAYHWKSPNPPAAAAIEEIGLLHHLADGTTEEEVELDSVR